MRLRFSLALGGVAAAAAVLPALGAAATGPATAQDKALFAYTACMRASGSRSATR